MRSATGAEAKGAGETLQHFDALLRHVEVQLSDFGSTASFFRGDLGLTSTDDRLVDDLISC